MIYSITKKNNYFIDSGFSLNQYSYKRFNDKINDFKKDFGIFLDKNKKIINKPRKNFFSLNINKLFKKLVFDSTSKVLKNYEKNSIETKKRFFSAKRIQNYKDKKII